MILAYGDYRHALAEAGVTIQRETIFSSTHQPTAVRERWQIDGTLHANSPEELTLAIEQLAAAYERQGQDAVLYLADGVTPTAHRLFNRAAIGGVRVTRQPSFPQGEGAEYSTFRSYSIVLEAELSQAAGQELLLWEEVLSFTGGGPRWILIPTLDGLPIRQQVQRSTPYRVTQSGRAIGARAYPAPAKPIWPDAWHQDATTITRKLPQRIGGGASAFDTSYEVTWNYQFEAAGSLVGQPTRR